MAGIGEAYARARIAGMQEFGALFQLRRQLQAEEREQDIARLQMAEAQLSNPQMWFGKTADDMADLHKMRNALREKHGLPLVDQLLDPRDTLIEQALAQSVEKIAADWDMYPREGLGFLGPLLVNAVGGDEGKLARHFLKKQMAAMPPPAPPEEAKEGEAPPAPVEPPQLLGWREYVRENVLGVLRPPIERTPVNLQTQWNTDLKEFGEYMLRPDANQVEVAAWAADLARRYTEYFGAGITPERVRAMALPAVAAADPEVLWDRRDQNFDLLREIGPDPVTIADILDIEISLGRGDDTSEWRKLRGDQIVEMLAASDEDAALGVHQEVLSRVMAAAGSGATFKSMLDAYLAGYMKVMNGKRPSQQLYDDARQAITSYQSDVRAGASRAEAHQRFLERTIPGAPGAPGELEAPPPARRQQIRERYGAYRLLFEPTPEERQRAEDEKYKQIQRITKGEREPTAEEVAKAEKIAASVAGPVRRKAVYMSEGDLRDRRREIERLARELSLVGETPPFKLDGVPTTEVWQGVDDATVRKYFKMEVPKPSPSKIIEQTADKHWPEKK